MKAVNRIPRQVLRCSLSPLSAPCLRFTHSSKNILEKSNDDLSLVDTAGKKATLSDLLKNKTVVLFGVPGAFTPVCTSKHVPSFLYNADKIKSLGVDDIYCVSVNDHFVMRAWANAMQIDDKIKMYADPAAAFTSMIGMEIDLSSSLGGTRSKRYSAIVKNGVITSHNVEQTLATADTTDAKNIITQLEEDTNKKS